MATAGSGVGVNFSLTGDKALDRELRKLPAKFEKKALRKALRESAKIVRVEAQEGAPKLTGALAKSIKIRTAARRKGSRRGRRRVGIAILTGEGFFKGQQFYAGFQELGTRYLAAKRFLRSALFDNRRSIVNVFRATLKAILPAIAREAAAKANGRNP